MNADSSDFDTTSAGTGPIARVDRLFDDSGAPVAELRLSWPSDSHPVDLAPERVGGRTDKTSVAERVGRPGPLAPASGPSGSDLIRATLIVARAVEGLREVTIRGFADIAAQLKELTTRQRAGVAAVRVELREAVAGLADQVEQVVRASMPQPAPPERLGHRVDEVVDQLGHVAAGLGDATSRLARVEQAVTDVGARRGPVGADGLDERLHALDERAAGLEAQVGRLILLVERQMKAATALAGRADAQREALDRLADEVGRVARRTTLNQRATELSDDDVRRIVDGVVAAFEPE